MATTSMDRPDQHERLEKGEKALVFGVMTAFAVEGFFAIIGPGIGFSWLGIAWGVFSTVFVLALANKLYSGSRPAYSVASVWSAFQVILSLAVLLLLAFNADAAANTKHVTLPTLWMAAVKFAGYAIFSACLLLTPRVRDFLDVQRGAELAPENPLAPTGVVVTFTEDQKQTVASLGSLLKTAGVILIIVGTLQGLLSIRQFIQIANNVQTQVLQTLGLWLVISFLPAIATVSIGILMFPPAGAAQLIRMQGADMSYIMNALMKLRTFFFCLTILIGLQLLSALFSLPLPLPF